MKSTIPHFRSAFAFIEFLYSHGKFCEFMENFTGNANPDKGVSLFSYLSSTPSELFVANAFEFDKTSQEFIYWMDVDFDWQTFLTEKIK